MDGIFICELGPVDDAITGGEGEELSDRWEEALVLKRWAQEDWSAATRSRNETSMSDRS